MNPHASIVQELTSTWPKFHGVSGEHMWGLPPAMLNWIAANVRPNHTTIETGCGFSTIVFALAGCRHTVISPVAAEHARIRQWGEAKGIDFGKVTFIAAKSEDVLPSYRSDPIQIALIDGWHAFPGPFLDWFFLSRHLAVGGLAVVDDVQLRACRILRDFLRAEKGRWALRECVARAEVFEKLTDDLFVGDWNTQPFCAQPYRSPRERFQHTLWGPLTALAKRVPGVRLAVKVLRAGR